MITKPGPFNPGRLSRAFFQHPFTEHLKLRSGLEVISETTQMLWDFLWDKMGIQMPIAQGLPDTEVQITEFLHKLILEQNSFAVEPSLCMER